MRLIDADALKKALAEMWYESAISITGLSVAELIDNAPTIEPSGDEYVPNKSCFACMERANGMCKGTTQEQSWCPHVARNKAEPSGENTETKFYDNNGEVYATITKPSGDLISRADAIEAVCNECEGKHYPQCDQQKYCMEVNAILALPSTDRPKGEWVKNDDFICSECGYHMIVGDGAYNFCPNCGAKMKGGAE